MTMWNSWGDTATRLFSPLGIGASGDAPDWDIGGRLGDDPAVNAENKRRDLLYGQAASAGQFADQSQQGYRQLGQQGQGALAALQRQAQGQDSVSAEQLRQAMQQNLAQQRSLAAGASPQNSAMAARTAAIQSGRINAGLAGQQAVAGLQERNQAQGQYGQLLGTLRGQDLNATLGSRQTATQGYGAQSAGQYDKSLTDKYGNLVVGGLEAYAKSDRRAKKDIRGGETAADAALKSLRSYTFAYKNAKDGKGKQLGVMAQDLERAGLGHAVMDTPDGKMVHGAKLATSNTAMLAALSRRVAKIEGGKER